MLGVPEVLNFYFSRIFPIQRTVLRTVRPVAQRITDMPIPTDDVFAAVKALYGQMEGMGPLLQDPGEELDPDRAEPGEDGDQRVAAALHVPEPLRLPGGRGDRQPRAARGGALALLRPLVRASRPGTWPSAARPSTRCPSSRRRSSTARWSGSRCSTCSAREVFGETDPAALLLHATSRSRSRRKGAPTRSTSGCPSRRRTASRSGHGVTSSSSRWTTSAGTWCCPARLAGRSWSAAFKDQRLRVAFGDKEAHEREAWSECGGRVEEGLLPGVGDPGRGGARPRARTPDPPPGARRRSCSSASGSSSACTGTSRSSRRPRAGAAAARFRSSRSCAARNVQM